MMTFSKYLKSLKREIVFLLGKKKTIPDFITKFLFLLDVIPEKIPEELLKEIEDFNYIVGCYEPDLQIRLTEPIFTSDEKVFSQAEKLLVKIDFFLKGNKNE